MPVVTDWVRYQDHLGYLAVPERAGGPLPAVLVIQEIFGVGPHIEDVTRRLAAAGYAALAPDLYAVDGARPAPLAVDRMTEVQAFLGSLPTAAWTDPELRNAELAKRPEAERARIEDSQKAMWANLAKVDRLVPPLLASTRYLREQCDASRGQKVACVGFCMGGGLSALLATRDPELSGAAIFYGTAPPADKVPDIACPVIGFYAGLDQRVNAGLPGLIDAMQAAGKPFEHTVYDGAYHGFFNDTRGSYHVAAARDSFARLLEFLRRTTGT